MRQVFLFPLTLRACVGFLLAVVPIGDAWLRAMRAGVAMRNSYCPAARQRFPPWWRWPALDLRS